MATRAEQIFYGECVDRSVTDNPGLRPTTTYVFRVLRPFKGVDQERVTFSVSGAPDGRGFLGMPVYEIRDRRLLMLYPPSASGLTSPMGLDQGSFRVVRGADGEVIAVNGRANRGLFRDVSPSVLESSGLRDRSGGAVRLEVLQALIDELARKERP